MKTFRASNGNTSVGETFWLIAAMRIKDRSGPGMVTVATSEDAGVPAPADPFAWLS